MEFCSIASGSSGNCTFVGTQTGGVLVDAGISGVRITTQLNALGRKPEELDGVLITHEHADHIQSVGVFARKYHVPIYATRGTIAHLLLNRSVGKLDPALLNEVKAGEMFSLKDLKIRPFPISHDAAEPVGYRFFDSHSSFAVATDMGSYDENTVQALAGLDAVLLEANHDVNMLQAGPYPYPLKMRILGEKGHLSNDLAGNLLCEILHDGMKQILLGHLSKENNYAPLAFATVSTQITLSDLPYQGDDFKIEVASRDKPSDLYQI